MPNIPESLSQTAFAELFGVSPQAVSNWCRAGMPHEGGGRHGAIRTINVRKAVPWVVANRTQNAGSERERLAKEQADKFAIDNARSRTELVYAHQVRTVVTAAITSLEGHLKGLPGRVSRALAKIDDPALVRAHLQDEIRKVRKSYAEAFGNLGEGGAT